MEHVNVMIANMFQSNQEKVKVIWRSFDPLNEVRKFVTIHF